MTQTETTPKVLEIVSALKTQGLDRILNALSWIHKNLKRELDEEYKSEHFRKRTATEIIESGKLTGCTDYALVFLALIRASGIDAKYVEAIEVDWLKDGGNQIKGHIFAEVKLKDSWYIVDPQAAVIKAWYGKRYEIYARGEDSWDIGIKNFDELKEKFQAYRKEYLKRQKSA